MLPYVKFVAYIAAKQGLVIRRAAAGQPLQEVQPCVVGMFLHQRTTHAYHQQWQACYSSPPAAAETQRRNATPPAVASIPTATGEVKISTNGSSSEASTSYAAQHSLSKVERGVELSYDGRNKGSFLAAAGLKPGLERDRRRIMDVFQKVPMVGEALDLLGTGRKMAARQQKPRRVEERVMRRLAWRRKRIQAFTKGMVDRMSEYLLALPAPLQLHPYEATLLDLTVGMATYLEVMRRVINLRANVHNLGKHWSKRMEGCQTVEQVDTTYEEALAHITQNYSSSCRPMGQLKEVVKALRFLPTNDPMIPTVALVGAPNVGKSSIVRNLSSGTPEVCHYPFTTRSLIMGHFYVEGLTHQVTDTPGILLRGDGSAHNAMEYLTLAVLRHLPVVAILVADPTGDCGTTARDQWGIRQLLRRAFPGKLWLDVITKADLLQRELQQADEVLREHSDPEAIWALEGPSDAVKLIASIPTALRVSSVTDQGYHDMRLAIVDGLASTDLVQQIVDFNISLNSLQTSSLAYQRQRTMELELQ